MKSGVLFAVTLGVAFAAWSASGKPRDPRYKDPSNRVPAQYKDLHESEASCGSVALDDPKGPAADIPVRDQSQLGSCTAHAAAVLIDAYLAKKYPPPSLNGPPNHVTSPLALFFGQKLSSGFEGAFKPDVGGNIPIMIDQARVAGSCDMNDHNYDAVAFKELVEKLQRYDDLTQLEAMAKKSDRANLAKEISGRSEAVFHLPTGVIDATLVAKHLESRDHVGFWNQVLKERCVNYVSSLPGDFLKLPQLRVLTRMKGPEYGPDSSKSMKDIQRAIDDQLSKQHQPVGIGYCSAFFRSPMPAPGDGAALLTQSLDTQDHDAAQLAASQCGMHASVVVGRKWRKGGDGKFRCMYRIHNSWGSDVSACQQYAENRRAPSTPDSGPDSADCEGGKIWIDQTELSQVVDVNFLQAH